MLPDWNYIRFGSFSRSAKGLSVSNVATAVSEENLRQYTGIAYMREAYMISCRLKFEIAFGKPERRLWMGTDDFYMGVLGCPDFMMPAEEWCERLCASGASLGEGA